MMTELPLSGRRPSLAVRIVIAAAVVALAGLAGACDDDEMPSYGVTADRIEAGVSDRFAITLDEDPSLGDAWQFRREADPDVVRLVDDEWQTLADDPETVGAGGTRTLTFEAVGPGETEIVLFNCFRCDDGRPPAEPPPGDIQIGGPYSWSVAVE